MNTRNGDITILTILIISALIVATAAPAWAVGTEPPTPFLISGEVNYDTGEAVPNPTVTVENTNTLEVFVAEIFNNSYQVSTDSSHVSVGDVLHFNASNDNVTEFNHTVTQDELDAGGFVQDIIINHPGALMPDLIVEGISVNPDCQHYYFANESNVVAVTVKNIGAGTAGASHVKLNGASGDTASVAVGALAVDTSEEVSITDTIARPAGELVIAIADCNGEVDESDETNNESAAETVINHGLKGKTYTGGENITTKMTYELNGNLVYSVGDSEYVSGYDYWTHYTANWTASDLPVSGTIKEARLYAIYTWDKDDVMPDNVAMSFNGVNQEPEDTHYWDSKGFGYYNLPYGMLAYDVTSDFVPSGNSADLTKTPSGTQVSMRGMLLVVVYEDANEPQRLIFVNEEFDNLYGKASYCTTPEEATAWAPITGPTIDTSKVMNATLITVAPGAANEGELIFNGQTWTNVWNFAGSTEIGIDERDVKTYLDSTDNEAGFQSSEDWMEASNAFLVVEYESVVQEPDLIVTDINAYHNNTGCTAWFNLSNEIDITVKNDGDAAAGASSVSLYIEGDYGDTAMYYFGKLPVPGLGAGNSSTVTFTDWVPIGDDCLQEPCNYADSYKDYNFTAVADGDGVVIEGNETNNATTMQDRTCYNGYMGDDPLENVAHGVLHGGVLFTTGDGSYGGLYSVDDSRSTNYNITIPEGASVEFAHLKVFYTWHYEKTSCPQMAVSITNATGTYDLPLEKAYNDLKCTCPGAAWVFPWGNYVYDLTDYIQDGGAFTVTVTRTGGPSFCVAAPGVDLVYEDENAPLIEYWINEGADVLMGGRRYSTSSNLAWWECISNATFQASTETGEVVNATIGVVAPWGDSMPDDILFFNDIEIGRGVYDGYSYPCSYTIDSLTLKIEGSNAQVGINVSDVTDLYLKGSANMVGQADDGDNIMACNAFLVVEYETEEEPDLVVSAIEPNCGGYLFGNESNELCAVVDNIGGLDATTFNVSFGVDGFSEEVRISGLSAGANTTVCVTDTTLRNAGDAVTITVTADCNAEVAESNETNNASTLATTVVNNGYKGKRYTGGEDITTWETFEVNGNLLHSVGDSAYVSGSSGWTTYDANWTASDLPVPEEASIEEARLFVPYTWDKDDVMPDNVCLSFNSETQTLVAHYSDRKGYDGYNYPYGMLVYDITDDFNTGGNSATLTKSESGTAVSMRGMLLVVIYEDDNEPLRKIILNEEFDLLYGGSSKCTTPEEATAYAPLGAIDLAGLEKATLITVAPGADGPEGDLLFNGQTWTDVWSSAGSSQIGINETDVTAYLDANTNEAGFQSSTDYMEASNAFLVLEYGEEPIISYGDSVHFKRNVRLSWRALDEPDRRGALMFRNAKIAIELEDTIPECEKVSVWVRRVAIRPPTFEVGVSSDGSTWTPIGTETCTSLIWTRYDFTGDWDNVKYIGIRKIGGSFWRPKLMGLDAVSAEGW